MKTNIKFTGFDRDDALRTYAQEKFESFGKLVHGRDLDAAICDVEFSRHPRHQSGDVCYVEVTLEVGGDVYRVSKEEPTFEKAVDKVKDDMLELLRAEKGRAEAKYLKGAREAKGIILENES